MERLFKDGLITTIIGVLLIGGAAYMYLSKDFTSMEAGELAILGMVFLRAKNSLIMLAPKKDTSAKK